MFFCFDMWTWKIKSMYILNDDLDLNPNWTNIQVKFNTLKHDIWSDV